MLQTRIKKIIPILIWMLLIFLFSSQVADDSNTMSLGITELLYKFLQKVNVDSILSYDMMNHYIRKLAHFTIYLVLGLLMIRPFYERPLLSQTEKPTAKNLLTALTLCALYAMTDEFHQSFVPGRAMMFSDVLIDSVGSLVGIVIYVHFLNPLASNFNLKYNKQR